MITNSNHITGQLNDFSLQNIESIVGFHLNFERSKPFENHCLLDIDFLIWKKEKQYIASFRFYHPNSIHFESGGLFQQLSIGIYDISDRGWEDKKYEVIDYEGETLHFYCTEIELMNVKEA
ncbi:hypothetical protein [Bacillus sp. PS06]|uniref:hypothetical protein n=1 Tax=Bacillus sp. PS06 TaxID=2764176 RepID=UPI00177F5232|nr:hypothetical protein [Bacillus sp. PS06]MBD8069714.1 hypothetical protein [Bacillus sp. PS06]